MTHYRYGATLRPFGQLNLNRLEACTGPGSFLPHPSGAEFAHGTMAFHRRMSPFEESQFDLTFLWEFEEACK
jgi:hypothetical protein